MFMICISELIFDYENAFIRNVTPENIKRKSSNRMLACFKLDVNS